ncbi:neuropeptides B/W receptor type 2-like [Branchiostoma lanceolatum]|uniref:neuropeptides B/W receptor type 2-like n=1 Tax=Branchiostoma lanceolatum TaxID=7740 RepID=UPI0034516DE1
MYPNVTQSVVDNVTTATNDTVVYPQTLQIVNCLLLVVVMLVGTTANVLSFATFVLEKSLRTPANIPLLFLAVVDGLMCGLVAPLYLARTYEFETSSGEGLCRIVSFFFVLNINASACLIAVVGVFRVITVVYTDILLRTVHPVISSCVVAVVSLSLATHYAIFPATTYQNCVNKLYKTPPVKDSVTEMITVSLVMLSLVVVAVCYCKIYRKTKQHMLSVQPNNLNNIVRVDVVTLRAAILILITFAISYIPLTVGVIWNRASRPPSGIILLKTMAFSIVLTGSMLNPFIYITTSSSFRKAIKSTCRRIFCCEVVRRWK